jgi:uncharacterized repeat protein (TIGR03806 family)
LNLFADNLNQIPNEGVLPYDLTTPLFSDYSAKWRFVWMPEGTSATYHEDAPFDFPVGTVLVKTFGYLDDIRDASKGHTIIETRLLIHQEVGWTAWTYEWNDDYSDAELKVAGRRRHMEWVHYDGGKRMVHYIIPNLNQCKGCHVENDAIIPIGPKGRNLNRDFDYADGTANQLTRWAEAGYLKGAPEPGKAEALPDWEDADRFTVDQRSRAWLDINCAHCHNPKGPANTTGLDLRYEQDDPYAWGVRRTPVAAGRGSGGLKFDIEPGKPDESIMVYRLASTEPGVMMPELPRLLVHDESLALIRQWIGEMPLVE